MSNGLVVPYPAFSKVVREVTRCAKTCAIRGKGQAILVLAGSGSTKTFLLTYLKRLLPRDDSEEVSHVPVVGFSIPPSPTQRALGSALLHDLADPKHEVGTAQQLLERAIFQLGLARTSIICIDNVQDIPERRRTGGVMQLGNWIRDLIDGSRCLVLLLGTPAARRVTDANAQLRRRVAKQFRIGYFSWDTELSRSRFLRLLHEFDVRLPLAAMSNLSEFGTAQRLYWATYGIMDYLMQILSESVTHAVENLRERLTREDLQAGFQAVFGDAGEKINPFLDDGPRRLLDQDGEPFHNWHDSSNPDN